MSLNRILQRWAIASSAMSLAWLHGSILICTAAVQSMLLRVMRRRIEGPFDTAVDSMPMIV